MTARRKPIPAPARTWEDPLADLREAARPMPDRVHDVAELIPETDGHTITLTRNIATEIDALLYEAATDLEAQGNAAAEARGRVETLEEELGDAMDKIEDTLTVDELGTLLERIGLRQPAPGWTPDAIREVLGQVEWEVGLRRAV